MDKILTFILIILVGILIKEYFFTVENFSNNVPTKTVQMVIPESYPMTLEFEYDNMDNVIENDTLIAINELTDLVIEKINKHQPLIIYNNSLRQGTPLTPNNDESTAYGKHLVDMLNKVAIYKYYKFVKINNISKDQVEHQMRLNFHIDVIYNSKVTSDKIPLSFNVIMLFEQLYDDDAKFHDPEAQNDIRSYLETFRLNGLPNRGFLPGIVQK